MKAAVCIALAVAMLAACATVAHTEGARHGAPRLAAGRPSPYHAPVLLMKWFCSLKKHSRRLDLPLSPYLRGERRPIREANSDA